MAEPLILPTKPRNKTEEILLDEIAMDPSLKNPELKGKVTDYIKDQFYLVAWHHSPAAMTKFSFEEAKSAQDTYNSYGGNRPTPKIVGIQTSCDMR